MVKATDPVDNDAYSSRVRKVLNVDDNGDNISDANPLPAKIIDEEEHELDVKDDGSIAVQYADTGNIDAFGRLRVSQLTSQIDLKQLHDDLPLFYDEEIGGTGTSTHSSITSSVNMTVSVNNDFVIRQTKQRFNYQTGKSFLVFETFSNFIGENNVIKRVGYFNSNIITPFDSDKDGLWLESDGVNIYIVVSRDGTITSQVAQTSWNLDRLDGTGPSSINIDWTKAQILVLDFEWLGVGRVRWGVVIDGNIIYFHETDNANNILDVYMSTPNHSIRYEIRSIGGAGSLKQICATVGSEGGLNQLGKVLSYSVFDRLFSALTAGTLYVPLAFRLKAGILDALIDIIKAEFFIESADRAAWFVFLNSTVNGVLTFNGVPNSAIEVAEGVSVNTITPGNEGILIDSGYLGTRISTPVAIENAIRLGSTIAGVRDTIYFAFLPLSNNATVLSSATWRELI